MTMESPRRQQYHPALVAINIFALIAVVLLLCGYLYYQRDKREILQKQYEILSAVNELKSQQIQRWRNGLTASAEKAATDRLLIGVLRAFLAHPQDRSARWALQTALAEETRDLDPVGGLLFDTNANLLTHADDDQGSVGPATLRAVKEALATNKPVFSDLFRPAKRPVHLDIATAVRDEEGKPLAVLVVRHNAEDFLFPMIAFWPTPNQSAETLILQRDGGNVLHLNEARHQPHTALRLREGLTATEHPAVQAVLGHVGIFEGTDYRGMNVVSDIRPIPGTPWFIESKMDSDEIAADARFHALLISLIVGLTILLASTLVAIFYKRRQNDILRNLILAERGEMAALETARKIGERHLDIIQTALDGFLIIDRKGFIKEVNSSYCRITNYSAAELLTMHITDLATAISPEDADARMQRVIALGSDRFETIHRRKDGSLINFDVSVQYRPTEENFVAFVRDTTQQKADHIQLARISRLYAALSSCNETIVRAETLDEVFSEVCRIIVEHGGISMVGIVMPDKETGHIGSVAAFGKGKEYLQCLDFSLKTDAPDGRGPIATALQEHRAVWIQDFQHDPMTTPWHERGKRFGWQSSAAIPLGPSEKPLGAMTLYSAEIGSFDESVRDLLVKIGNDLAIAMENFAMEEDRKIMENSLYAALDRSAEASRAKSEFLAVMSHELRTPLNGVLGFSELLTSTPLNQEQIEYVRLIQSSGQHLLNIVSEILDFSSIEKGKIKLESAEFNTAELVEVSFQTTKKAADDKGLSFRYEIAPDVPATITGDLQRIRQILLNLLGNAIKFTASGSVILSLSLTQTGAKKFLNFSIRDTGPGIPEGKLDRLFKPFSQVDSSLARKFQGAGLGLAISKRLAEAMGGTLTVTSVVDRGSEFTFSLPLESAASSEMR